MPLAENENSRVLHITFDMGIGGTEQVIRNLITGEAWAQHNVNHHLCCIESPLGPWGIELQEAGIPVSVFQRKPKLDRQLIREIRHLVKRHRINIIHAHQYTPFTYGFFAALLKRFLVAKTHVYRPQTPMCAGFFGHEL